MVAVYNHLTVSNLIHTNQIASSNQSSANSTRSTGSKSSTKNNANNFGLILACGLPWRASKADVVQMFANFNILNGEVGVHFIVDNVTDYNDAFIQLASSKDAALALKCKEAPMLKHSVKRMYAHNIFPYIRQCITFDFYIL